MKIIKLGLASLCATMLCVVVAACSGGGQDAVKEFSGTWSLVDMSSNQGASAEDIALLQSYGLVAKLQLNEDGTGSLDMFGDALDGTWTAASATQGTLVIADQEISMNIDSDGRLALDQNGSTMIFQRGEVADAAASSSATASQSSSGAAPAASEAASAAEPTASEAASTSAEPAASGANAAAEQAASSQAA